MPKFKTSSTTSNIKNRASEALRKARVPSTGTTRVSMVKAAWLRARSPIWTITLQWRPFRRNNQVERRPPKQVTKLSLSQPRIKSVKHLLSWSTRSLKVVQTVTESKGQRRWAQPGHILVLKCFRTCSRSRVCLRTRSLAARIGRQWGTSTLKMLRQGRNSSNSSIIRE